MKVLERPQARPPAQFEKTFSEIARPAPKLGEHAEENIHWNFEG